MAKVTHATRPKAASAKRARAAPAKAKAKPRAKATWTFGGFDGKTLSRLGAQAKMEVSKPEDALEHEADRVADHVMRMAAAPAARPRDAEEERGKRVMREVARTDEDKAMHVQRACATCADEDHAHKELQRKAQTQEEIERAERRGMEAEEPTSRRIHRKAAMEPPEEDRKKVHRLVEEPGEVEGSAAEGREDEGGAGAV